MQGLHQPPPAADVVAAVGDCRVNDSALHIIELTGKMNSFILLKLYFAKPLLALTSTKMQTMRTFDCGMQLFTHSAGVGGVGREFVQSPTPDGPPCVQEANPALAVVPQEGGRGELHGQSGAPLLHQPNTRHSGN